MFIHLYKHMYCRLGDGQYNASDSAIDLSLGKHLNIERGTVLFSKQLNKVKEVHFDEMKMYMSITTFGKLMLNQLYALLVSVNTLQEALS